MNPTIIIVIVLIILAAYLYILYYPKSTPQVLKQGPFDLNGGLTIVDLSDLAITSSSYPFLDDGEGAFQCFVYLDGNVRTGNASDCGSDTSEPSCGAGTFDECECTDFSCGNCSHKGYRTLLNVFDTYKLEVLTMPDASRQSSVSAQIVIKTVSSEKKYRIETFPLPPLPEQKWTMITISKQGRQIFVYYNSSLVLSKKTYYTFSTTHPSTAVPVSAGDKNLSGNIAMATFFPSHQAIPDVSSRYNYMVDTRGNLNTLQAVPTSSSYTLQNSASSVFITTLCLDGSCFNARAKPTVVPKIPSIYAPLETSYA